MTTRILLLALLLLCLPFAAGHAQEAGTRAKSLPVFRSEAELSRFVQRLMEAQGARRQKPQNECSQATEVQISRNRRTAPPDSAAVIHGRVVSAVGVPLSGAQIQVQELNAATLSSPAGEYRLPLPAEQLTAHSTVTLRAALIGYASLARPLDLSPGDSIIADLSLCAQALALESIAVAAPARAGLDESVTNVQHAGVDEGGIVKTYRDYLVILRRGRLFTVRIGSSRLTPVSAVDAFGPGIDPEDTWYDELLVSGDVVMVIGYSYLRQGTEIGVFRIDPAGRLLHRSTYQLRANDYYSSRNYSSRLIDGKLVFYAPLALWSHRIQDAGDLPELLPGLRRWRQGGEEDEFRPIASATRIYRPARELDLDAYAALHTVTTCDVSRAELDCHATAVFGPWGHTFYVSPRAVYVWLGGWSGSSGSRRASSMLYRMPLDGSIPSAIGVAGSPIDQFSFLESEDGHLNVLVSPGADGQWMWRAERAGGSMALLRLPLSGFGDGSEDVPVSAYRPLPAAEGYGLRNRFVGNHLLYGTGSGWGDPREENRSNLHVVDWRTGRVSSLSLPHCIDRIEAMGTGAVIVGSDEEDLHFTSVRLSADPALVDRYTLRQASQGELRSHGFFYRGDDEHGGVLGLPVRGPGRPGYEHLFDESASILFLHNRSLRLAELGELAARPERATDDGCRASCVDWYGNARPLFLRGRVLALLGYEIVEGDLREGRIQELRRTSFAPIQLGARSP